MATATPDIGQHWLRDVGDFRWLRGHVSLFFVGTVLLISGDLLSGTGSIWSVTATGIWLLLLVVHALVLAIARLSITLIAESEDEEIVLLPVKDAVIVDPVAPQSWVSGPAEPGAETPAAPEATADAVSWQIAIDAARGRKQTLGNGDSHT